MDEAKEMLALHGVACSRATLAAWRKGPSGPAQSSPTPLTIPTRFYTNL
jgi:hypothetical protein